ncbi:MAG: nuclear transport factor 2 family protein [Flammeovirgaceae bacterium]|nr:MAG: nuclear transport factor 2 family protein [Flammeovirgaceae bacterium]
MNKAILVFLIITLAFNPALSQGKSKSKSSASANDELVIKSLIEKETKAFFEIDYTTWADCWIKAPYAFWSFADTTDVNSFTGWEAINKGFANYFKTSKPSKAKIERTWRDIRIYGNGAYARFTQHVSDDTERPPQEEVRVLEKINGQWKIVCVSVIAVQKENQPVR